jgi:hypothetical protein
METLLEDECSCQSLVEPLKVDAAVNKTEIYFNMENRRKVTANLLSEVNVNLVSAVIMKRR